MPSRPARIALQHAPDFARVTLDNVIKTMWDTAVDMNSQYKKTADGECTGRIECVLRPHPPLLRRGSPIFKRDQAPVEIYFYFGIVYL